MFHGLSRKAGRNLGIDVLLQQDVGITIELSGRTYWNPLKNV
jgi:hypothetical protein